MANSVYRINKGINKSIEFKGLKAQYIWYLGIGILVLLMLFATMYLLGAPSIVCVVLISVAGTGLVIKVYALSNKYGEYGMLKALAKRNIPKVVKRNCRKVFVKLNKSLNTN